MHLIKSAYFLLPNIDDDVTNHVISQLIFRTAQLLYVKYMKTSVANVLLNKSPGLPAPREILKIILGVSFDTNTW